MSRTYRKFRNDFKRRDTDEDNTHAVFWRTDKDTNRADKLRRALDNDGPYMDEEKLFDKYVRNKIS